MNLSFYYNIQFSINEKLKKKRKQCTGSEYNISYFSFEFSILR